jgi:ABC-type transport system substrate-binding protein
VIDGTTVRLNLKEPQAPLPSILTDRAGMMISPKAGKALGEKFGNGPVCAGPFKFVSRVAQARIIFEKSPTYWDNANVHIDRVEFTPVTDTTVRLANLQSGQFDLIERVSPTDVAQIKSDKKLVLTVAPDLGFGLYPVQLAQWPARQAAGRSATARGHRPVDRSRGPGQGRLPGRIHRRQPVGRTGELLLPKECPGARSATSRRPRHC